MKSPDRTSPLDLIDRSKKKSRAALVLFGLMIAGIHAAAQPVVPAPPAISYTPPALPQAPATDSVLPSLWDTTLFQWGPVTFHPHLSYRFLYGNGIQSSPGHQNATSVNTISLGVLATLGEHWSLDYTPSKTYYSDPTFKDSLNHAVSLQGGTSFEKWTFQLSQTFNSSSTPLIETGKQTKEDSYATTASVDYRFTDRIQLDTTASYQVRSSADFNDSRDSMIGERLHYQFSERVDTSISVDYGSVDVSSGTDMTYTRPALQLKWNPTEKISLGARAGIENRKFKTGGADDLNSPTFSTSIQYRPFTTTSVSFSADRGVSTSYFSNQVTRNTGWTLELNQRLLEHYYLNAGYTGQKSSYISTDPALAISRDDRNYSFNVSLSTVFFQRASVSVFYQNTHNTSNDIGFGFNSSQVGFDLGYKF